jgi:Pretoxin HINT domain
MPPRSRGISRECGLSVGGFVGCGIEIAGIVPPLRAAGKVLKAGKGARKAQKAVKVAKAGTKSGRVIDDVVEECFLSFGGETRVLMADGSTKPISDVEVGDMVFAQDPETGEIGVRKVTDLWVHHDDLVRLEIDGDVVRTTEDHPFWNDTDQQWQRADQLDTGDLVLTAEGHRIRAEAMVGSGGHDLAYNLTVEDLHTYHVLFGNDAVLVHNKNTSGAGGRAGPVKLPGSYSGRLDAVPGGGGDFEIHVFKNGEEIGFFGSNGWFNKHGRGIPTDVPEEVYNALKGRAIDYMRASGRLPAKGKGDISGDKWKRPRC